MQRYKNNICYANLLNRPNVEFYPGKTCNTPVQALAVVTVSRAASVTTICVITREFVPLQTILELTEMTGKTREQYDAVVSRCRRTFIAKMGDYGPSWRLMRPSTVTDQIFIKAARIRQLETSGVTAVGEGVEPEFMAIINYGIVGMIQLEQPSTLAIDMSADEALAEYDNHITATRDLMLAKNTDYNEAWRDMLVSSFTDIILTKLIRVKHIEANAGVTAVSEGIASNYQDMINYAVFALIKLGEVAVR